MKDLTGQYARITGKIIEHLKYASNEWLTVKFPDGSQITINKKFCEVVDTAN